MAGAVRGTRGAWGEDYAAAYLRRHGMPDSLAALPDHRCAAYRTVFQHDFHFHRGIASGIQNFSCISLRND